MRIAFISETFLPKVDGVVTRLLRTLDALDELGHDVLVLAPPGAPSHYRRFEVIAALGLPFPWYPELKVALPSKKLADTLRAFDPDLIHVVNPVLFGLWGEILARRLRLPLVASFHTNPGVINHLIFPLLQRPLEIYDREVHNLAHLSLCTSPQMVDLAREIGIKRVRLWPKAVDSVAFHPDKSSDDMRYRLTDGEVDKTLVIYIGRLSWEKRLELLVEAIPRLRQARWAFVGSGPAEADLRRRLADTPTVFTGYMSGEDLAQAYASADVFAFPSDTETLGFAVMEAMASGLAVVGAEAGGVPDIIRHGENGLLFRPGDVSDLIEKLSSLITDAPFRERLALQARMEMERLGWRAATETLLGYYQLAGAVQRRSSKSAANVQPT
ncbi:MAG: glycosyltransferase [Trueperaceae bacterium]|nr:MAG: glycosyltransferase [Trueperaceae bacterium]